MVFDPWTYHDSFRGIVSPKCVSKETLGRGKKPAQTLQIGLKRVLNEVC
jgi:hypothetical protein